VLLVVLLSFGTLLIGLIAWYFAELLISLLYGVEFIESQKYVGWYVLIYVIMSAMIPVRIMLMLFGHSMVLFVVNVISAIWVLVAAIPLIHLFGVKGGLACMVVSYLLILFGLFFQYKTKVDYDDSVV